MTLKQACSSEYQGAQGAFKDSMIHWILQFTLLIAFRCVLHRCESQEIRCWKLYKVYRHKCPMLHSVTYNGVYEKRRPGNAKKASWRRQSSRPSCLGKSIQVYKRCTGGEMRMVGVHMPSKEPATTTPSSFNNDPSAGSPTETLLRLLLPLNDQVWSASQQ